MPVIIIKYSILRLTRLRQVKSTSSAERERERERERVGR